MNRSLYLKVRQIGIAVSITDAILGPYSFSCPLVDPTEVINLFCVIKSCVVTIYCLIIARIKWPLCSADPQIIMKTFADILFPGSQEISYPSMNCDLGM